MIGALRVKFSLWDARLSLHWSSIHSQVTFKRYCRSGSERCNTYSAAMFICLLKNPELKIRRGSKDNSKIIFSFFLMKTDLVTPHQNCLGKTVLMRVTTLCLY